MSLLEEEQYLLCREARQELMLLLIFFSALPVYFPQYTEESIQVEQKNKLNRFRIY